MLIKEKMMKFVRLVSLALVLSISFGEPVYASPDTLTLRPNDFGSETSITTQYPPLTGEHYDKVDEETADDDETTVWETDDSYHRDLYNLPAPSGSGTINFIKIYFRCCKENGTVKPSLKTNSTPVDGTEIVPADLWTDYSEQWNTNPVTTAAWTWDEIDALQIGISVKGPSCGCTQIYVEIDYTPPSLYESYTTGGTDGYNMFGALWKAQTFTPATTHLITSVKLQMCRAGSPGTLTVSIRATDVNGHPTGADLCSGTIDGDTLTQCSTTFEWRDITFGAGYTLSASTKYAIVARAPSGTGENDCVRWKADGANALYEGGNFEQSANSGSNWTWIEHTDFMFEEWGVPVTPDISNAPDNYNFGSVSQGDTPATGLTNFTVTNNSSAAIDITISGTDMTGGEPWILDDDGNAGENIYGLKAGLEAGDYTIVVKKNSPYNPLVSGLAASGGTQKWGLKLYVPASFSDEVEKTGTVTLTATVV